MPPSGPSDSLCPSYVRPRTPGRPGQRCGALKSPLKEFDISDSQRDSFTPSATRSRRCVAVFAEVHRASRLMACPFRHRRKWSNFRSAIQRAGPKNRSACPDRSSAQREPGLDTSGDATDVGALAVTRRSTSRNLLAAVTAHATALVMGPGDGDGTTTDRTKDLIGPPKTPGPSSSVRGPERFVVTSRRAAITPS